MIRQIKSQNKSHNKICGRLCVEMTGSLLSPISVGSGEQNDSDRDVIFNAQGKPYIPGSSLAGAFRSYAGRIKEEKGTGMFGAPYGGTPGDADDRQSRMFFYDTLLEGARLKIRDGVKLNEDKKAVSQAKYTQQIVERGARFRMRIEVIQREADFISKKDIEAVWKEEQNWFQIWLHGFRSGELRIGAKSRRGFGRIDIDQIRFKKFDMTRKDSYLEWLDWDWDLPGAFMKLDKGDVWTEVPEPTEIKGLEHTLEASFHIRGTLMVRTYGASDMDRDLVDYEQLVTGERIKKAVIPGSSMAGAFRSHIAKIIQELAVGTEWESAQKRLEPFFGTWTKEEKNQKLLASKIVFEETVVEGGKALPVARIAVDRFTGGTVDSALYESLPWSGGNFLLRIRWQKSGDPEMDHAICGLLLWAVEDLQSGILPIGGETAIGRGICEPDQGSSAVLRDGQPLNEEEKNTCMRAAAGWVRGDKK